jgi:hypothetical protein
MNSQISRIIAGAMLAAVLVGLGGCAGRAVNPARGNPATGENDAPPALMPEVIVSAEPNVPVMKEVIVTAGAPARAPVQTPDSTQFGERPDTRAAGPAAQSAEHNAAGAGSAIRAFPDYRAAAFAREFVD